MKNVVVFITPKKQFFGEYTVLVKVFVDNSLDLGWEKKNIILVTNFPFEYNGIKAIEVDDSHYCRPRPRSIKTSIIPHLVDSGLIVKEGGLYWNHDLDAFQMNPFDEKALGLEDFDAGLTDYGWKSRWCMGSYFFKHSSHDIFRAANPIIFSDVEDEDAVQRLHESHNIEKRCKRLNITYNFGMRKVEYNFEHAEHPIQVVHFHPTYKLVRTWDVFVLGKNGLNKPIVNDRLVKIFNHHKVMGAR